MNSQILIIEDDKDIQELIKLSLTTKGISSIDTADDIEEGLNFINQYTYNVILLDLNLKSEDGYELMKYIDLSSTSVIVVTSKEENIELYRGFEKGVVDYIKKPFDPMELYYRVSLHLKETPNDTYKHEHLTVNFKSGLVQINEQPVTLTARELDLLFYFINNKNQILSKDQIYAKVWGYETSVDDNTLMVHIRMLRRKIEKDPNHPQFIKTLRGKGYIFKDNHYE